MNKSRFGMRESLDMGPNYHVWHDLGGWDPMPPRQRALSDAERARAAQDEPAVSWVSVTSRGEDGPAESIKRAIGRSRWSETWPLRREGR